MYLFSDYYDHYRQPRFARYHRQLPAHMEPLGRPEGRLQIKLEPQNAPWDEASTYSRSILNVLKNIKQLF